MAATRRVRKLEIDGGGSTPPGLAAIIERNCAYYDQLPYISHPFPATQPARMAGVARLFGLNPPPVETARVLEIGCASGGNLIPLAARFPRAQFLGVDLSPVQVAAARQRATAAGIGNIAVRQCSITEFEAAANSFDYVICHGVFSWVTEPVREAILAQISALLAPDGVADVSYNVLPGWRMRQALRDAMTLHAGLDAEPLHRVARARWILQFLAERTNGATTWGQMFRNDAAFLARLSDDYIAHEFLEPANEPMTFNAFMGRAEAHGLAYLGDADVSTMIPENLDAPTAAALRDMCGGKAGPVEQYMDIVTGRTFRQSLLVPAAVEARIDRRLDPGRMLDLHLVLSGALSKLTRPDGATQYTDPAGRALGTARPDVVVAIDTLCARAPASARLSEIIRADAPGADGAFVCDAIVRMMQVGMLAVSTAPVECVAVVSERPVASPLARADAARSVQLANARHEAVTIGPVAQVILPALDGSNDLDACAKWATAAVASGRLAFVRDGAAISNAEDIAREARGHVEAALARLAAAGLLIA